MSTTKIKSFEIIGLFGTDDVFIPFNDNYKILIGENGLGKTQVLNLFYYTLTQNFIRLSEYNFEKLRIVFSYNKAVEISKKQIDEFVGHPLIKNLISEIGYSQFEKLWNGLLEDKINGGLTIALKFSDSRRNPREQVIRVFKEFDSIDNNQTNVYLFKCRKEIKNELKGLEILYFPTYRRVEEDLHNLGYNEKKLSVNQENNLIQFGMGDVKRKFNFIQKTIDRLLKEGLAQFTKDILNVVI